MYDTTESVRKSMFRIDPRVLVAELGVVVFGVGLTGLVGLTGSVLFSV